MTLVFPNQRLFGSMTAVGTSRLWYAAALMILPSLFLTALPSSLSMF
jgi:hypothetical protein